MTLTKIADLPQSCLSPDHNPPSMVHLEPGVWQHTCSGCGKVSTFTVQGFACCGDRQVISTDAVIGREFLDTLRAQTRVRRG